TFWRKFIYLDVGKPTGRSRTSPVSSVKRLNGTTPTPSLLPKLQKKRVREATKTKSLSERQRQLLDDQKSEITSTRDAELHQICAGIVKNSPGVLEEIVARIFRENPLLKKACQPGKQLLESYQEKPMLRVLVDQYVIERYPERF